MGEFQVVDNLEISISDADDLLPNGTAWFGFPFSGWFRCPSCAIAAFLFWVQLVAKGCYSGSPSRDGCISGYLAVLRPLPPPAAGTPAGFLVQA